MAIIAKTDVEGTESTFTANRYAPKNCALSDVNRVIYYVRRKEMN